MTGTHLTGREALALQHWAEVPDDGVLAVAFVGLARSTCQLIADGHQPSARQVREIGAAALTLARRLEATGP